MTLNQLFWKLTKEEFHPSWGCFGRNSKNNYNLSKIMLHSTPRTLIMMLNFRQSIYLVLIKVLSASFLMLHITFGEISTTLSLQFWYKGIHTRDMWSNGMFILWNCFWNFFFYQNIDYNEQTNNLQSTKINQNNMIKMSQTISGVPRPEVVGGGGVKPLAYRKFEIHEWGGGGGGEGEGE